MGFFHSNLHHGAFSLGLRLCSLHPDALPQALCALLIHWLVGGSGQYGESAFLKTSSVAGCCCGTENPLSLVHLPPLMAFFDLSKMGALSLH